MIPFFCSICTGKILVPSGRFSQDENWNLELQDLSGIASRVELKAKFD